jgi:prepilin-type N-terminal cleavage/methylation domain-containing protein
MRIARKGFTLIELLVVMAITAILITLIGIPLIQGLNLTRAGQAFSEAQDVARELQSRLNKELSTAALVLDNSTPQAAVEIRLPLQAGGQGWLRLHNAKIDFVPAAKGDPSNPQYNPGRNKQDPTLRTSIGQVIVPLAPGQTLRRYWIGLRRPLNNAGNADGQYTNPWISKMAGATFGPENLYVLYTAEVEPYVYNQSLGRYTPNTAFFPVDPNTGQVILDDPGFFEYTPRAPIDTIAAHRQRFANWLAEAHLIVQDSRTDVIMPEVDEASGDIVYEPHQGGGLIPRVRPLVTFTPARVSNEPALGNDTLRMHEEATDNALRMAPEFFQSKLPGWTTDTLVRFYRQDPRINPRPPYYIARWRQPNPGSTENFLAQIVAFDPQNDVDEYNDGDPLFSIAGYMASVQSGNPRIGPNLTPAATPVDLVLFTLDQRRGRLQMRFPAQAAFGGPVPSVTTANANAKLTGWLASPTRATYNPSGDLARRFLDLRDTIVFPATAPNFNPLQPNVLGYFNSYAKITPGSETVFGPDQKPGANFGRPVRYTRVAPGETPGLNQYKVNYTDQATPNWTALGLPDPAGNTDVRDFIEPRFKKGYIEFHSDPTLALPVPGNIDIAFDFQLNEPRDAVVVDYDSNQQLKVEVTIRRYYGGYTAAPQTVTIADVVAIRNFAR